MDFVWFMSFKRLGTYVHGRGCEGGVVGDELECKLQTKLKTKTATKTEKKKSMMRGHY